MRSALVLLLLSLALNYGAHAKSKKIKDQFTTDFNQAVEEAQGDLEKMKDAATSIFGTETDQKRAIAKIDKMLQKSRKDMVKHMKKYDTLKEAIAALTENSKPIMEHAPKYVQKLRAFEITQMQAALDNNVEAEFLESLKKALQSKNKIASDKFKNAMKQAIIDADGDLKKLKDDINNGINKDFTDKFGASLFLKRKMKKGQNALNDLLQRFGDSKSVLSELKDDLKRMESANDWKDQLTKQSEIKIRKYQIKLLEKKML